MPIVRRYDNFELHSRPTHPLTGKPADYYVEFRDGRKEPRWNKGHLKDTDPAKTWLPIPHVSRLLGLSGTTVRRMIHDGDLPATQIQRAGGKKPRLFVNGADLLQFTKRTTKAAPMPRKVEIA